MTGKEVSELMGNRELNEGLAKHARRYSKRVEDQEEYIQDAWLRIAEQPGGRTVEWYEEEGARQMRRVYQNKRYNVRKKKPLISNGISVTGKDEKPPPGRAIHAYANKYVDSKHTTLDWQYYDEQEEELINNAIDCIQWYNQYDGFEALDKREQEKVANRFINSGYQVGMPTGATPGKKTRYYEMYYTVDNSGVVVGKAKPPIERAVKTEIGDADSHDWGRVTMDLSPWYKLRGFGGSDEWMADLNKIISDLEAYNATKEAR